ncbi:MAG: hydrogenase expression/formation protein HypE [Pelosinus sp.]|nr:hydrogenase expression/formation protein HypE [Pelosinus sp.]
MYDKIELAHGSGGRKTQQLIKTLFQNKFNSPILDQMLDAAILEINESRLAFTTDSFVVTPLFFPGGDIGKLAVYGTVNDLAVSGAIPLYMSAGILLEEGFLLKELQQIVNSMAEAAQSVNVQIVTGDTKVVEKGAADKLYINTSAIGVVPKHIHLHPDGIRPGDAIIISGQIGEHGLAIKARRQEFIMDTPLQSDSMSLVPLTQAILEAPDKVRCMRDATRGGIATTLNELAEQSGLTFLIEEEQIPVSPVVHGACQILGLDPLYLANEGKFIAITAPEYAKAAVTTLQGLASGKNARIIGKVINDFPGAVVIKTILGAQRILPMLDGDPLPRIC